MKNLTKTIEQSRSKPIQFDSLADYLRIAESYVKKFCQAYGSWHLFDDDAIGKIAYMLIVSDIRYDPSKGAKKSTYRYRNAKNMFGRIKSKAKKAMKTQDINSIPAFEQEREFAREERGFDRIDLEDMLSSIPRQNAEAIELLFLDNMSRKNAATQLNITQSKLDTRVRNGLKIMRNKYASV